LVLARILAAWGKERDEGRKKEIGRSKSYFGSPVLRKGLPQIHRLGCCCLRVEESVVLPFGKLFISLSRAFTLYMGQGWLKKDITLILFSDSKES
jgi:hypothetical protein